MKTVILCGGLGTRLKEETEYKPKPMVRIGGRPMLWHIMKFYSHYGFTEFVLCLGYKGEVIKEYFYNYESLNCDFTIELGGSGNMEIHTPCSESGWKVTLANTGEKTLKGGRIKRVEKFVDGDVFMVTYGDGIGDVDLKSLVDFHSSHGKVATVTGVLPPSRFGSIIVEREKVVRFTEKPQATEGIINGGFFVFDRRIFDYLSGDELCDLETGVLDRLAEEGELMVYRHGGNWVCMDNLRDMEYLNSLWSSGKAFWRVWE